MADDEDVTPRAGELTTANYGWTKPNVGDSDDAWGGMINADLDSIDSTVKSVSNVANAAYPASNPSGYQTAANVTASLAPYALTASVPAASSTTPAMDGTAAVGTGTTWAKADHVHPSNTAKLSLTGGTLTGPLTPAGIVGTTTNDSAAAGQIGEVVSSNVTTGVTLTTGVGANVTNVSLTAGDWDVCGEVWISAGTGAPTAIHAGINTVSGTIPTTSALGTARTSIQTSITASTVNVFPLRSCRVSLAVTTTYYLTAQVNFPSGTMTATGNIMARRAR